MGIVSRRGFLAAAAGGAACSWRRGGDDLVQEAPGLAPSYWSTWGAQCYASGAETVDRALREGGMGAVAAQISEERLFGGKGWARALDRVRQDLYLLIDVGWDLAPGAAVDREPWLLGGHEVSAAKFPSAKGSPTERLRRLNELCVQNGWRGAGLWVAAQPHGEGLNGKTASNEETENQLRDRLRWSRDAGIAYWKVDAGARANGRYRQLISEMALEEAPSLVVEHCRRWGPLNDEKYPWEDVPAAGSGEFHRWGAGRLLQDYTRLAEVAQVFRTGETTGHLSIATTLDRVAALLVSSTERPNQPCLLNCEDEPYLGAVLGCTLGITRHPAWADPRGRGYNPRELHRRMDEVTRAVRWQRMAPPFAAGLGRTNFDDARLADSWMFQEGESRAYWLAGKTVPQSAPARVARNMALPQVGGPERPFVVASLHPNDSVAVATLPRVEAGRGFYYPLADVTLTLEALRPLVAVFGRYRSLTLQTPGLGKAPRILAQDLAGETPRDITARVAVTATEVVIPGEVLHEVGLEAGSAGDISDPGLVLRLSL